MEDYMDGSVEGEDLFPCKGCGEILEEGKAFELAGNRWHLNCFRCNTCGTLLDSDANLLLLGDGSLICNNCTYSCSACGDKIEDLAILTGDQAFCAACFRCRNCKRKIENLRYARTSQGIFCMSCHESLMARRRKKSKAAQQAKAREKEGSPMVHEKSLPALPPAAIPPNAFSNDRVDPEDDAPAELPTELSPRPRPSLPRNESSPRSNSRSARSPERSTNHGGRDGSLSLPSHSYRGNRNSTVFSNNPTQDEQNFFISIGLDTSPQPAITPSARSTTDSLVEQKRPKEKDYFGAAAPQENKTDSQASTPHIAFQAFQKEPRQSADHDSLPSKSLGRKLSKSSKGDKMAASSQASPIVGEDQSQVSTNGKTDEFRLQDAPKSKKSARASDPHHSPSTQDSVGSRDSGSSRTDKEGISNESPQHSLSGDKAGTPRSSQDSRPKEDNNMRTSDPLSMTTGNVPKTIQRKEVPSTRNANGTRPHISDQKANDSYMTPRAPPAPPGQGKAQGQMAWNGEQTVSPKLPNLRESAGGDFTMDEDMARILGTDETSSSILRRVSNAVRHGRTNSVESSNMPRAHHTRSISETTRTTTSPRWPKTPANGEDMINGSGDITSPLTVPPAENPEVLKRRLRNSEQRVAELERNILNEEDLKEITQKLEEKRKTVSTLDTQTEIMIRQLEVLAGHVETAKEKGEPIDTRELEDVAIKEFAQKLDRLKQSMTASLEQLHAERNELLEEKNAAIADRDRARVEFEQLVSKNAQLADLNNDLTHQIQERVKNHSHGVSPMNGLGIYQNKGSSNLGSLDTASIHTGTTLLSPENEEPTIIDTAGPTVVEVGKGRVVKRFNWKKGSKAVAQNIAKGVNRTVVAFQQPERHEAGASIGMPYNMTVTPVESPVTHGPPNGQNRGPVDAKNQGFFGGFKKTQGMPTKAMAAAAQVPAEPPHVLFGSELADRAEYERRQIPCVVTRCIEEVELRGMETEGIYRKTGGNSQVKIIQDGFDKNESFDISDPDMDITAVTSVLKQYFRKLPTPLLTYDIYDRILETNSITTSEEKITHLQSVFEQLPRQHKDCLEFLMFHLSRVASREGENLMTPRNLAVVFAPTIMRDTNIEREMTDMHAKNLAVQFVIENSQTIFS